MTKILLAKKLLILSNVGRKKNHLESVALPSLAADDEVRFINENAAKIAIQTVKDFLERSQFVNKIVLNVDEDDEFKPLSAIA